jgi:hypothetical protein
MTMLYSVLKRLCFSKIKRKAIWRRSIFKRSKISAKHFTLLFQFSLHGSHMPAVCQRYHCSQLFRAVVDAILLWIIWLKCYNVVVYLKALNNLCALKIIIGWYCGLVKRFQKWIQVSILLSFWCHRYWSNGRIERLKKVMVRLSCFAHNKARVREGLWLRSRSNKYICDRIKDLFVFTIMTSQRLSWCWAYSYDGLGAHEIVFKLGYVVNVERWGRFLYIVKLRSKSAFILLISILVVKNIEFTDLELCIIDFPS